MPAANQQKRIIVVLGMHRSGTSVITRGLQVLGVSLGDRLLPAAADNPKGFWEDQDVNALNIALLQALGHDWHTLAPILPDELAAPVVTGFKLRAVEILRDRLSVSDCFGLKDPRMARLLPFWEDVIAHLRISASYVIVSRNPLSVARSLAKRNGFDLEKGYYLWLEHMLVSLERTHNRDRIVTDYDRFLENPARELRRIAEGLELNLNPGNPQVTDFITSFLDNSLRHNHHRVEDFALDNALPPLVVALYQALLQLSVQDAGCENAQLLSLIENIRAQHQQDYPALRYMESCDHRITTFTQQIGQLRNDLAAQQAALIGLQRQIAELNCELGTIYASGSWKIAHLLSGVLLPFKRAFASLSSSRPGSA